MRNKLYRKILVCAILILFVGISTMPIASSLSVEKNSSDEKPISSLCAPPVIDDFVWELSGSATEGWTVTFSVYCYDKPSGMDRVEFSLDDDLMFTDNTEPSPYIWVLEDPFDLPN